MRGSANFILGKKFIEKMGKYDYNENVGIQQSTEINALERIYQTEDGLTKLDVRKGGLIYGIEY